MKIYEFMESLKIKNFNKMFNSTVYTNIATITLNLYTVYCTYTQVKNK